MKRRWDLAEDEVKKAIADHVRALGGYNAIGECETELHVSPRHDLVDRPTGGYTVTATVTERPGTLPIAKGGQDK